MSRQFFTIFTFLLLGWSAVSPMSAAALKFEDILEKMLVPQQAPAKNVSQGAYLFAAGDPVIRKQNYTVYFSGFDFRGGKKTLLMTLVENGTPVELTFPDPGQLQIRDVRLRVVRLDNEGLEIQLLSRTT